jgi:hypothetical protein
MIIGFTTPPSFIHVLVIIIVVIGIVVLFQIHGLGNLPAGFLVVGVDQLQQLVVTFFTIVQKL